MLLGSNIGFSQTQSDDILNDENVTITNERTVNTDKLDFSPAFYEDGIVFISSSVGNTKKVYDERIGRLAMAIKIAKRGADGVLGKPEIFAPELTSEFHEGPLTFDNVTEEVFFSRNNSDKNKLILLKNENGKDEAKQQIYTATKVGNKWTNVKKLAFNIGEYAYRHPTLSHDGKKLYFSSNCPGGKGGYDIWVATREGDSWSEPVNLGEGINTAKNEAFPFIHPDGTLFFASDGRGGVGKLDIFYAKANKKEFGQVINVGKPFNSSGDDFGFILDQDRKNGYLTSNRAGTTGEDDIYSFHSTEKIPTSPAQLAKAKTIICVKDQADQSFIQDATVKYVNISEYEINTISKDKSGSINKLETSDNLNILQLVADQPLNTLKTNDVCQAPFVVNDGDYLVNVTKEGYAPKQVILKAKAEKTEYLVLLEKLKEGKQLVGTVKNDQNIPVPNAVVTITDDENGPPQEVTTDPNGNFDYVAKPGRNYSAVVRKPNYETTIMKVDPSLPLKMNVRQVGSTTTTQSSSSPFVEGQVFELTNVYYNYNDATLRPDALRDIQALQKVMKQYPDLEIELSSHTDCRSTNAYNQNLSQRRAESVVKYLVNNGIATNRMRAVGYGESQLRNQCADGVTCSEEEHQRNRRTEVKITKAPSNAAVSVVDRGPEMIDSAPQSVLTQNAAGQGYGNDARNSTMNNSTSGIPVSIPNPTKGNGKKVVTSSTVTSNASSNNIGQFLVIVGSFGNKNNAAIQQQKMKQSNYVNTTIEFNEKLNLYRVIAEKYDNLQDAENLVNGLRAQGFTDTFYAKY